MKTVSCPFFSSWFFREASPPTTLRFFASNDRRINKLGLLNSCCFDTSDHLSPTAAWLSRRSGNVNANEKFGEIFKSTSNPLFLEFFIPGRFGTTREGPAWYLLALAIWNQKISEQGWRGNPRFCLHGRANAKIVCHDTLVQYAAYSWSGFFSRPSGYHSIPIILWGATLHLSFP